MAGLLLIVASAFGSDCALGDRLNSARDAVLALDFDAGSKALEDIENDFECGANSSEEIARFWLITAALASFQGDEEGRDEALLAARVADDSVWIEALGADMKSTWALMSPPDGESTVKLTDLSDGYEVRLDGTVQDSSTVAVTPGLHVIQARGGDNGFGRILSAGEGDDISLPTGLPTIEVAPEPTPEPVPDPQPVKKPKPERVPGEKGPVALHFGAGLAALVGPGFDLDEVSEPSAKIGPMLEAGVVIRPADEVWVRVALGAEVALAGRFVYLAGDDTGRSLPLAPALTLSSGVQIAENIDVGGMVGAQLPSRIPLRALAAYRLSDLLAIEGRFGVNLVGETTLTGEERSGSLASEPAFGALATFSL